MFNCQFSLEFEQLDEKAASNVVASVSEQSFSFVFVVFFCVQFDIGFTCGHVNSIIFFHVDRGTVEIDTFPTGWIA